MKPNELRIGNLIDRGDVVCKVLSINQDGVMAQSLIKEPMQMQEIELKGLPLTEEWLKRMGFGVCYQSDITLMYEHPANSFFGYNFDLINGLCYISLYGKKIKCAYVHQLQNVYFTLTGEELTLK